MKRVFTWLLSPALVVALAVGAVLLLDPMVSGAPAAGTLGSLKFDPATGTDLLTFVRVTTSGGCAAAEGDDATNMFIVGPIGSAHPTFPPDNPFPIVRRTKEGFSTTSPIELSITDSLKALAQAAAGSGFGGSGILQAGEYDITVQCVNALRGTLYGTFTGAIFFTDPTHYNTGSAASPSPSASPTPSPSPSLTPSSSPSPRPSPAPTATPEGATPTPAPGTSTSADTSTPTGPSAGTSSLTSTGTLANTGAPITLLFLGGLLLLAAGLVVVFMATCFVIVGAGVLH